MSTIRYRFYSPCERVWHWCQAAAIALLVLTGLAIHSPGNFRWIPFATAVQVHNGLGLLLMANAVLGLLYYVATGAIRQFLPEPRRLASQVTSQARFYLRGMFQGEPHPVQKVPARRLNPLQQVTYLVILNVFLPAQLVTGLLMWSAQRWPDAVHALGGLPTLGMIHTLGAWLFSSFLVMHLYLITTGHTPLANLKAMVLGYEDVPAKEKTSAVPS